LEKVFDMDFFAKIFVVFLNSPYRETPKNSYKQICKQKPREKKSAGGCVWDLANARGGPSIFLAAPRALNTTVPPP
jgi:hypothetical protein